eukprot:CAMPEP_0206041590 /NCGR_PEP_ID=MMETSP1466-20131121/6052_1 /ASSEMBLY_ACC=CAM_ASM_001126 /TAXON_ID=44452 /ORGANISM="Pavlova gyrans, Strain CCMP608" /LENGTH=45 /DNA_ID= /DNA_START= /DNA_END= /DNA_ORIENTATION=
MTVRSYGPPRRSAPAAGLAAAPTKFKLPGGASCWMQSTGAAVRMT